MKVSKEQSLVRLFIERSTAISWLFSILPYLIRQGENEPFKIDKVYFIDSSKLGLLIGRLILLFFKVELEELKFRLVNIKDEAGNLIRERIVYFDLPKIKKEIVSDSLFEKIPFQEADKNRISTFLAKQITTVDAYSNNTVWCAQFLIQVAAWKVKSERSSETARTVLFIDKRVWVKQIEQYAFRYKVKLVPTKNIRISLKAWVILLAGRRAKTLQGKYFYIKNQGLFRFLKKLIFHKQSFNKLSPPKLVVQHYGQLNLDKPELHSDLFFWQQSNFFPEDILVMFNSSRDPLDKMKLEEIKRQKMSAVGLSPGAVTVPEAEIFYHWSGKKELTYSKIERKTFIKTNEEKWLKRQLVYYSAQYNYWFDFFSRYNAKVYLTWFRYSGQHCIIADVMEALGGLTAIYQRAFEEFPSATGTIDADINFGFSYANAEIERSGGSCIPYYVTVGYIGDHRFPLLKKQAQEVKNSLQKNGAKYIIAFSDENSADDFRWHTGHEFMRINYEFLLEKLLSDQGLGLVIKPKVPSTLCKRLGPVAELLKQAENTGRCFVFEGGAMHGTYPPAAAALAADVAIHGHLAGVTAGVEAALAGVPTLIIDREGWPISSLYKKLGKDKVIFTDWSSLWQVFQDNFKAPGAISGFGDWSSILKELDPFRDGRAAERVGTYLKWLLDGFKAKLSREKVLALAAERYGNIWGYDKVMNISKGSIKPLMSSVQKAGV